MESYKRNFFDSKPFFVINDKSYQKMSRDFENGTSVVYSHIKKCSTSLNCSCVKFSNIMKNGEIYRVYENEEKPVISQSMLIRKTLGNFLLQL
jgi:hypothetical protein